MSEWDNYWQSIWNKNYEIPLDRSFDNEITKQKWKRYQNEKQQLQSYFENKIKSAIPEIVIDDLIYFAEVDAFFLVVDGYHNPESETGVSHFIIFKPIANTNILEELQTKLFDFLNSKGIEVITSLRKNNFIYTYLVVIFRVKTILPDILNSIKRDGNDI